MLARLFLLVSQLAVAWLATPALLALLPPAGGLRLYVYGIAAAGIVFAVGLVLSQILPDTAKPSRATLLSAVLLALAGALLVSFRGDLPLAWRSATRGLRDELYPLLGAALGYLLKR
jgi:hypothetical protein